MYFQTGAIILKNLDFKEADKLVTFLASKEGKLRAVAKGIKKPNSSLRGPVQPFCHSRLHISRGRELGTITQAKVIDFFGNIREDLDKTLHMVYLMDLLDKSLAEADPHPQLFNLTLSVLRYLEQEPFSPLVIRWFEIRLAGELGYRPGLYQCMRCREAAGGTVFSISDGGLLCSKCSSIINDNCYSLDGESLAILRILAQKDLGLLRRVRVSPRALQMLEFLLERYLEYYLERKLNLKGIIRTIKKVKT